MPAPNFSNRTVWVGDNLHVMRGINSECIDLIYLDPPFNSNQDYAAPIGSIAAGAAFKDTWTLSDIDTHEHGELADRNPAAYSVIEAARNTSGKSMMSYLIMMAVRLIEMERILKPTGSIYLHCDPTASHYLKLLMDAVFGGGNFRNEITWQRTNAKGLASRNLPNNHDIMLRYTKSDKFTWNQQYVPHDPDFVDRFYKHVEESTGRRYTLDNLVNPNRNRPNLTYEFLGVHRVWRWTKERMQKAYEDGIVIQTKPGAVPRQKRYLDEQKGAPLGSVWSDIKPVQSQARERTGYPTQKPIALLDRIIEASSNEGDFVFDPFCGCATTLVAADRLERQWAGIDLSPLAVKLVNERINEDRGALWGGANVVDTLPKRTDLGALPNYRSHRHRLYGEQEGVCLGCDTHFPFKVMEVDHILPKSRGGTDHAENLQLLCTHCNKSKGSRTMAEWRAGQSM
ncbi:MAG: DNA methyltransferase [Chloroflexota bacterium]|nr:DNA methyltransferase [Chloroflexota bacterium]MDE2911251.1 DNA methyltransferase [Chloroflexota bacterium]